MPMIRALRPLLLLCIVVASAAGAQPLVAAAANLEPALGEIAHAFARESGRAVRLVYGSSGSFRQQIAHGAPYEMFLSADEEQVEALAKAALTRDAGVVYATGRIAIVAAAASPLEVDPGLSGLRRALVTGTVRRFAIANPEHAPYGRAAKEALQRARLWDALAGKVVLGENVAQAAQFALADAQGGIVAYSQALAPALRGRLRYALLPESLHAPLRQRMVLTRRAGADAEAFYRYVQSPPARAVLSRYGFVAPVP